MNWIKKSIFTFIALVPMLLIAVGLIKLALTPSLLQSFYMNHVRNIYFDCIDYTNDKTVYRMKPGECILDNFEYSTVITSNKNGHRYPVFSPSSPDIAVVGDSHAHGFGVNDTDVFSSLISDKTKLNVTNFAIGSYDTVRELEAIDKFTTEERIIIIQYCDNDFGGNKFFINNSMDKYLSYVEEGWKSMATSYFDRKNGGYIEIFKGAAQVIKRKIFDYKQEDVSSEGRDIASEMEVLAQVLQRYEATLRGRKVIIFESSGWGNNSPLFKPELEKWLNHFKISIDISVLDSSKFLSRSDYYFLDDHLNSRGHKSIADELEMVLASMKI